MIVFHLFIALLAFGVASYDQESLFFYETYLLPDSWLLALRGGSFFGQLAVYSATLVCMIAILLLIFTNWFSWRKKLTKAVFFILPEFILGGWLLVFSLGLIHIPSADGDQHALSGRIAANSTAIASAKTRIPEKPTPKTPMELHQQLSDQSLVADQVTTALMRLESRMPDPVGDQKLRTEINVLQNQLPLLSKETRSVTTFLIAAALEKLDPKAALSYYAMLIQAKDPYTITGKIRKSELEATDSDHLEKIYKEALEKPATEGWFRTARSWEQTTTHRAANLGLVDLRKDKISIRILDWLRSNSLFPLPYAYLFALITLALAAKLVELPFLVATVRIHAILKPQIERIRQETAEDSVKRNSQIAEIYKNHGISDAFGMFHWFIDIAFAIWILLSLRAWAPQMELDGAKFFWIMNIFEPSYSVLVVWVIMGFSFMMLISKGDKSNHDPLITSITGSMGSSLVIVPAIAWFFDWPAYMTIAWMLLWVLSTGIQLILIKLDLGKVSGNLPPSADFVCETN